MALFIWKPSYNTGIPEIDHDHRMLIGLVNELYEAMKDRHGYELVDQAIVRLTDYAQCHFETEESFMRARHYPKTVSHQEEHRQFRARVTEMDEQRRAGTLPLSGEMMDFLCEWLRNHVTTADKELGQYLSRFAD